MKLTVITSYPIKNATHGAKTAGIASYTKNTLKALMAQDPDLNVNVYAERLNGESHYVEDKVDVRRVWKRNNIYSIIKLIANVTKSDAKIILAPIEVYMFGTLLHLLIYCLGLLTLKIAGKKIVTIVHQVADDSVFDLPALFKSIINTMMTCYYLLLRFCSTRIIVFEQALKQRLGNTAQTCVISHGIESVGALHSQKEARARLGLPAQGNIVLFFGFIAPYKGIDTLLENWRPNDKTQLIIAGGANTNHIENVKYRTFLSRVEKLAKEKNVTITGFVDEADIADYFVAADVLILPYSTFFSSSGPLSLAVTYKTPFLLSPALSPYFESPDFVSCLNVNHMSPSDFVTTNKYEDIIKNLANLKKNRGLVASILGCLQQKRSWQNIGKQYLTIVEGL